uniref:Variant surface glycoprotein 759 n=1 Tax=Trypanosoma brucei TaxID=5691 RepID=M4SUB3_9TRYP|nr:variant surface glycoprotein 759 [Trypanosoma brucei]
MPVRQWAQIIFIHVLTIRHSEAAEGDGLSLDAVKKLCSVTVRSKTTAKDIVAQLQARAGKTSELISLQAKLQLASCTGGSELKDQLAVLSVYVKAKIQEQVSKTEKLAVSGAKAATLAAYTAGHVDDALTVFETAAGESNKHCLTSDGGGAKLASLDTAMTTCGTRLTTEGGSAELSPPYDYSTDKYVTTAEQQPSSGSKDCVLTKHTGGYVASTTTTADNIKWAAGLLDISSAGPRITSAKKVGTTTDDRSLPILTAASTAYKAYHAQATTSIPLPTEDNYDSWKTDPKLNEAIKMFVLAKAKKPEDTDVSSQIKPEKQRLFGDGKKNIKTKVWDKLNGFPAAKEVSGKVLTKKISDLSGLDEIEKAAMVCVLEQKKFSTESEISCPSQGTTSSAEEVCNAIEDKATCDNNKQCTYHETVTEGSKKCKFNASKAKEKGVPVTQAQPEDKRKRRNAQANQKKNAKMVANGREQSAKISVFL